MAVLQEEEGLVAELQGVVQDADPEHGDPGLLDQHGTGAQEQAGAQGPGGLGARHGALRRDRAHTPGGREGGGRGRGRGK